MPQSPLPANWKFKSLRDIMETEVPAEPPWRIHGLVAEEAGTLVSALPHGAKSFTWLQASIEAALGLPVWGHFSTPKRHQRTLFIETEDPDRVLTLRVHQLARGLGIKATDVPDTCCFTLGHTGPFNLLGAEKMLKDAILHYKPDFTVLSTLQGLLGTIDWKEQSQMSPVNTVLHSISAQYSPLVLITHSPLDRRQRRAAGTVTLGANFATHCHYDKHGSNGDTTINVRVDSKLGTEEETSNFRLKLDTTFAADGLRFVYQPHITTEQITSYLETHPDDTSLEVAAEFGVDDGYVRKLRSKLHK